MCGARGGVAAVACGSRGKEARVGRRGIFDLWERLHNEQLADGDEMHEAMGELGGGAAAVDGCGDDSRDDSSKPRSRSRECTGLLTLKIQLR